MFNATFSKYRNLKWIEMTRSEEDIKGFFEGVQDVIFKPRRGECGHGVFVENAQNLLARKDLTERINIHRNYVCEEKIYNDEVLNMLNDTSLNTIRVITYLNNDHCNIIWAGIRIGKKGSVVDNISEGGSCCSIDIKTGKINSEALDEHSIPVSVLKDGTSIIGFQIPRWGKSKILLEK